MDGNNIARNSRRKATGKPFEKGDPRCWRKGRPRSFDALRELALEIANEVALENDEPVVFNGHTVTVCENILRNWAAHSNPQIVKAFLEIAFGKVPDTPLVLRTLEQNIELADLTDEQLSRLISGEKYEDVVYNSRK
jgi:hypothetical protein